METRGTERRREPRARLSQRVRVRHLEANYPEEVCTTLNVSRNGLCFVTSAGHYFAGMKVYVTRNFHPDDPMGREEAGEVVRVEKLRTGQSSVAIRVGSAV